MTQPDNDNAEMDDFQLIIAQVRDVVTDFRDNVTSKDGSWTHIEASLSDFFCLLQVAAEAASATRENPQMHIHPAGIKRVLDEVKPELNGLEKAELWASLLSFNSAFLSDTEEWLNRDARRQAVASDVLQRLAVVKAVNGGNRLVADSLVTIKQSEIDARAALADLKLAVADVGEHKLTTYYKKYGKTQRTTSNWFRGLTFVMIFTLVGLGVASHKFSWITEGNWADVAWQGGLTLILGAGAVYLSRLAAHHRRLADWANGLEVQLQTVGAFLERVPPEQTAAIYDQFALRVLGPPPGDNDSASLVLPADLASQLLIKRGSK